MSRPDAYDTAEAWRAWAIAEYHDEAPLIVRRRVTAQRDEAYHQAQERWRKRDIERAQGAAS